MNRCFSNHLLLIAQESVAVEGQLGYLFERLFSAAGLASIAVAVVLLALVFIIRKPLPILGGVVMALGSSVLPDRMDVNQLIGPLQSLRFLSKSLAFALLGIIVVLALPAISKGSRLRSAGFAATAFFLFQALYSSEIALFAGDGLLKGGIGLVTILFMYLVFAVGIGRRMQDLAAANEVLGVFAWVALAFVGANVIQILFGLSGALVAGRLAGIAGNAQMMGGICACLLVVNAYLASELEATRPLRWIALVCVGILGVLLLATGSRTGVLATAAGLFMMFRLRIGRFAILGVVVVIAYAAISLVLEDPGAAVAQRFSSGADTRTAYWLSALGRFLGSPIFGELPFLRPGDEASGVESTLFRTLANMGIIGGLALALPVFSAIGNGFKAVGLSREQPEFARLTDLYIGSLSVIFVLNIFDGYAFGLLTFPVLFTYTILTLGAFLAEQAELAPTLRFQDGGLLLPSY